MVMGPLPWPGSSSFMKRPLTRLVPRDLARLRRKSSMTSRRHMPMYSLSLRVWPTSTARLEGEIIFILVTLRSMISSGRSNSPTMHRGMAPPQGLQLSILRSMRKVSQPPLARVSAAQAPAGPPPMTATRSLRPSRDLPAALMPVSTAAAFTARMGATLAPWNLEFLRLLRGLGRGDGCEVSPVRGGARGGWIKAGWQKPCGQGPPKRERMCRRGNGVTRLADARLRGSDRAAIRARHVRNRSASSASKPRRARRRVARSRTSRTGSTRRDWTRSVSRCRYYRDWIHRAPARPGRERAQNAVNHR
mmetsp:Transcript_4970/g.18631  ORF Transcript_4970/g.18631 Transcript_4970/m.18631 type:complete len:305 (+) Transcript_4970:1084-1998(+)